jgi:hypothetical protein
MADTQHAGHGGSPVGQARESRAGQGKAGGRLTEAEPVAERRCDGARERDGGGFAEVAVQAFGRRGKRGGWCGERR